jgi:hypothetical protein
LHILRFNKYQQQEKFHYVLHVRHCYLQLGWCFRRFIIFLFACLAALNGRKVGFEFSLFNFSLFGRRIVGIFRKVDEFMARSTHQTNGREYHDVIPDLQSILWFSQGQSNQLLNDYNPPTIKPFKL